MARMVLAAAKENWYAFALQASARPGHLEHLEHHA
jgi:hypothetical protein